jgi:hypothetical protein
MGFYLAYCEAAFANQHRRHAVHAAQALKARARRALMALALLCVARHGDGPGPASHRRHQPEVSAAAADQLIGREPPVRRLSGL